MIKKVKELIQQAQPYTEQKAFGCIYLIPSGKAYDGFWGKNGYDNIIILGYCRKDDKLYNISGDSQVDAIHLFEVGADANIDIEHDNGCVRLWFREPITIEPNPISTVIPQKAEKD